MNLIPWLAWLFPFLGALLVIPAARINSKLRDGVAVFFPFLSVLMALLLLPNLFSEVVTDEQFVWIPLPGYDSINMGMLVDPLSIIVVNVVAVISFLIMIYSIKYMSTNSGVTRYWFLTNVFIGSMLLLVLSDNLIAFYIGWKIVGICSYGLIGHFYHDEKEYQIGGPPPNTFQKPSESGMKALVTTGIGDVSLLAGIIILFIYTGSFNYTTIFETASIWMAEMAKTPGMLVLTSILILGGPIAKSSQFPLHEWLPEAMAGPAPVSALIHAATMVKAGVYLVARLFPIFFFGYWVAGFSEANMFFLLAAGIGAFTAFLAGTQGLVAKELKKVLAYSTMSQIGYMMLALGVAGLSPHALIIGYTAGLFHLMSHAIFKAVLFLGAGSVIHSADSIYIGKMRLSRKLMPHTWIFMWVAALSLSGVPPLSGFWSKDGILLASLEANAYWIFAFALITVSITAFYSIRMMGLLFHNGEAEQEVQKEASHDSSHHSGEPNYIMLLPYGILAVMTVALGAIGPWFSGFLEKIFGGPFEEMFELTNMHTVVGGVSPAVHYILPAVSVGMFLLGAYPAYRLYIKKNLEPAKIIDSYGSLKFLHRFLWNRWYIDRFYNRVFIGGTMATRGPVANSVERSMDRALNEIVPKGFLSMRGPTVRFIERPLDRLFNEMVPKITVVFSEIGRKFDEYVIDGIANGIASSGKVLSRAARRIQTGVTEEYVFAYIVGAVILALFLFYTLIFRV